MLRRLHLLFFNVCLLLNCFLFPLLWYEVAMPFCFLPQMPWWLLLIIRARDLPFSVSIQWTHIYQVPALHQALQGGCMEALRWMKAQPACACIRVCLTLPAWPFLLFQYKDKFIPLSYFLLLEFFRMPPFLQKCTSACVLWFSVSISFDLASVLL